MTESTSNRDEWLAQIEQRVQAKVGDKWRQGSWSEFLKDVAWWLRNEKERDDEDTVDAAAGLIKYGIMEEGDLTDVAGSPPDRKDFREALVSNGRASHRLRLFVQHARRSSSTKLAAGAAATYSLPARTPIRSSRTAEAHFLRWITGDGTALGDYKVHIEPICTNGRATCIRRCSNCPFFDPIRLGRAALPQNQYMEPCYSQRLARLADTRAKQV